MKKNTIKVKINSSWKSTYTVPATLLGQNMEAALDVIPGLLSDRLDNPKFLGPANPQTGIAHGWQPAGGNNFTQQHYQLVYGISMSGNESQLVHNFGTHKNGGLLQTGRWLKAGEDLQVEIWAMAQHHPVTIRVVIRPWQRGYPDYDSAIIKIDKCYWSLYKAVLKSPVDDNDAVFAIFLNDIGKVWFDQVHLRPVKEPLLREDLIKSIASLEIPVLRFPGGCVSTNYHWQFGTGPVHLRPAMPDPIFKWEMLYDFGTNEYLEFCVKYKCMPHITINIGSGTPDEAGEWASYIAKWFKKRRIKPPTVYFGIGNEHHGSWELGNMTPEQYVEALKDYVPKIRKNYPKARIIALGYKVGSTIGTSKVFPWRKIIIEKASKYFDVLTLQHYSTHWVKDKEIRHYNCFEEVNDTIRNIQEMIDDLRKKDLKKGAAITEWNLWYSAAHYDQKGFLEIYDTQHALFVASMLNGFSRLAPTLELANFYNLVNVMGFLVSRGPKVEEVVLSHVFRLYRPAFPGKFIPLKVSSPFLTKGIPIIDAVCLKNKKGSYIFLVNRGFKEAVVDTKSFPEIIEGITLYGDDPESSILEKVPTEIYDTHVYLPPLSITQLHIRV